MFKFFFKYHNLTGLLKHISSLLLLYTGCRILFYAFNTSYFSGLPFTHFFYLLIISIRFDVSVIIISNSLFILLYLLPFQFREKKTYRSILKYLYLTVNSIALLANCIDLIYFRFTLKRTTADALHFFDGKIGNDLFTLLPSFLKDYWYVFFIWIVLTALIVGLYNRIEKKRLPVLWTQQDFTIEMNVLVVAVILAVIGYRGGFQLKPIRAIDAGEYTEVKNIPLVTSTAFTIIKTLDVPSIEPVIYFSDEKEVEQLYNPVKKGVTETFQKKNVCIIILESFSKEYIGALNGGKESYTPFLDSLCKESLTFTNAYANAKRSIEGIPAIVAGIPNWMNEPYISSVYASNRFNSLANLLKKEGYYSAFFHGGSNGTMGFDAFTNLAGYDNYYGRKEYNHEQDYDGNWGIWDEPFLQYVNATLTTKQQPFFASVFTLSSHHPFAIPDKYTGVFKSGSLPIHITIRYTDYALKRFFEAAKKSNWFNNTIFVLTADHTGISEDPFYSNKVGNNAIPIIFYAADKMLKAWNNTVIQQIDIQPTLLSLLHYPYNYFAFGNNVFDSIQSHYAFTNNNNIYELITDRYSYSFDGNKSIELFDISKDSLLKNNLLNVAAPEIVKEMEQKSKAIIQTFQQAVINNKMVVTQQ